MTTNCHDKTDSARTAAFLASLTSARPDWECWEAEEPDGSAVFCAVQSLMVGEPECGAVIAEARAAVRAMPHGMIEHELLDLVLVGVSSYPERSFAAVARPLFAYARHLQGTGHWKLAADLYRQVILGMHRLPEIAVADDTLAARASLYLGTCLRSLGQPVPAADAYAYAGEAACQAGNEFLQLKSRHGFIKASYRDDDGDAAIALRELLARCSNEAFISIRAQVLHDLGRMDFRAGRIDDAIAGYHRSWRLTPSQGERDRILFDLTAALSDRGYVHEAREIGEMLRTTSVDPEVRWGITINLMEFARMARSEPDFNRYRWVAEAERELFTPQHLADYEFHAGLGFETFGDTGRAADRYQRAISVAQEHGLARARHKAETALATLESGRSNVEAAIGAASTPPATIAQLTADVRAGRELVAVE
jgi:tetratricopeptide (TPR) repeat protein